jgi:sugar-specific transcriptional regulator TrmB
MIKDEKTINSLMEFGLNENEARVYLVSLSLGATTVLKLSQHSEVKRTTVYEVVDTLERKGLMKKEIKGLKTLYAPEHPEKLENTLENKRLLLAKVLPALEGKYHLKGSESVIKYYEGFNSIKNVYEDILKDLKAKDFYYAVSNVTEWQGLNDEYFMKNHVEKRVTLGLKINLLFVDSPVARERIRFQRNYNEEIRLLPENTNIHVDMVITPHKLVIFQLHEPMVALVIENQSMITVQKEVFELLWNSIGPDSKSVIQ